MSQCFRCNKPCDSSSMLCEQCLFSLGYSDHSTLATEDDGNQDIAERSLEQMRVAAQKISEVEPEMLRNMRGPRLSRLSPLHDMSGEIQHGNRPLPQTPFSTFHGDLEDNGTDPWLESVFAEDFAEEKDDWGQMTDPLQARQFPSKVEVRRVEEDDIQRAFGAQLSIMMDAVRQKPKQYIRILLSGLAVCGLIALVIDSAFFAVLAGHTPSFATASPTLSLSSNMANYGNLITVHLRNFTPSGKVVLSRNIQESLRLVNQTPLVQLDSNGSKDVTVIVGNDWETGANTIEAEDVLTHYTASSVVIIGSSASGTTNPAHLYVSEQQIDLGAQIQAANSLQALVLENTGGGVINWTASSSASWLFVSSTHGLFSDSQEIYVAGDRGNLNPGDYEGNITLSSNAGMPVIIQVHMQVMPMPMNAGATLSVSPPTLSFNAMDGANDPADQSLTVTNPGNEILNWSLKQATNQPGTDDNSYLTSIPGASNWLSTQKTSGQIVPGATSSVTVHVHSGNLLPGVYTKILEFATSVGHTALNSPQKIVVSLTVMPRCGVTLSTGQLSFTAIASESSPGDQSLSIMANTSCANAVSWHATSSVPWMTLMPASGQVTGTTVSTTAVSVNTLGLGPGLYTGTLTFSIGHNTQTVTTILTVQPRPKTRSSIMSVSPLSLNFSMIQGQANPPEQAVTITNSGGKSALNWQLHSTLSWLTLTNDHGSLMTGQSTQSLITVNASGLTPGTLYSGQIVFMGTDQNGNPLSGSPQFLAISFVMSAPCTLTLPSSSSLAFNVLQGNNAVPQQVVIMASGTCNWPITWHAEVDTHAPWLSVSPASGTLTSTNQAASLAVGSSALGLAPGSYSGSISLSASDSTGAPITGSPQPLSTMTTVMGPCSLVPASSSMSLNVPQGQVLSTQHLGLSLGGSCSLPVSWSAQSDSNWLQLPSATGGDSGGGSSLNVVADATHLSPGTYTGKITFTASGSGSAPVANVPTVTVNLTVTGGLSVNGTVSACTSSTVCVGPLPGATVSLLDSSSKVVATQTAGSDGSFSFANVANGSYTISVTGVNLSKISYTGTTTITVNGSSVSVNINALNNTSPPSPGGSATTPAASLGGAGNPAPLAF